VRATAGALGLSLCACGGGSDRPPLPPRGAEAAVPADSLVLVAPGGTEVWYTLARPGRAADGTACVDRALEIRRGDTRIPIPLLYTGAPPELVNDTVIRARLSDRCAPADRYLVSLTTGRPTPER
jgi:hypothetical protein